MPDNTSVETSEQFITRVKEDAGIVTGQKKSLDQAAKPTPIKPGPLPTPEPYPDFLKRIKNELPVKQETSSKSQGIK